MIEILKVILPIILSLSIISVGLKYIFSSHYRFQLNKKKFTEKQEGIEKLYQIYKDHLATTEKLPPFVLEAKVNACLGTDRYDHRLVFLLIKGNFASIETSAKRMINASPFLEIEYPDGNIKLISLFSINTMRFWRGIMLGTYLIFSVFLVFLIGGHKWFGSWITITTIVTCAIMYLCIWIGSRFSTVLSVERILETRE